ncbi:hypothetical protein DACRYDRAFT_23773 [Dacryopinax primogenitus]|uniref:Uncharacterized protein n=1 Tax=Dacryopinax primogenitus (strain DJM 731) TaxID=1858805 RepID=M5FRJ2_DACPD|nr:uncharacterized protein DACRYDRAFT_23773 [Dacryopinax primogenitus]EJT99765.1 hypothetical protein DACRYDRAFT_23773 [Dacryopinax primogenitus]
MYFQSVIKYCIDVSLSWVGETRIDDSPNSFRRRIDFSALTSGAVLIFKQTWSPAVEDRRRSVPLTGLVNPSSPRINGSSYAMPCPGRSAPTSTTTASYMFSACANPTENVIVEDPSFRTYWSAPEDYIGLHRGIRRSCQIVKEVEVVVYVR